MKITELRIRLTVEDLMRSKDIITGESRKKEYIRTLTAAGFALALTLAQHYFFGKFFISVTAACWGIVILSALRPKINAYAIRKRYKNYYAFNTDTLMEIYDDHVVTKNSDGAGLEYEIHYPARLIRRMVRDGDYLILQVSPIQIVTVPMKNLSDKEREDLEYYATEVYKGFFCDHNNK